jgi:putative peptidoglycan lipid II flippase
MYSGSLLERIGAVLALVALGGVVFLIAAVALGVLNKRTVQQLIRRQG